MPESGMQYCGSHSGTTRNTKSMTTTVTMIGTVPTLKMKCHPIPRYVYFGRVAAAWAATNDMDST